MGFQEPRSTEVPSKPKQHQVMATKVFLESFIYGVVLIHLVCSVTQCKMWLSD